jgi:transcription initiation factor IIE alpha subunit
MIGLDLTTGLLIYLFAWLITIAILWIRELRRIKTYDWNISNNSLFRCNSCHYSFLVKDEQAHLVRCPRCNAMCILFKKQ